MPNVKLDEGQRLVPPSERKSRELGAVGSIKDVIQFFQDGVLDNRNVTLDQIIFMTRNDGQAKAILNAIKYPLKAAKAKIKAAPDGGVEADFIRQNLLGNPREGGMVTPLRLIVSRMGLAVRDGYKVFEKVWKPRDGKVWLHKLAYRSTLDTKFTYDNHGEIDGAKQETTFKGKTYKPVWKKDKIAYYIYNEESNPYMGESDFYPVFYHYDKKHKLYAIAHLAYQLNAIPVRVGKHPPRINPEDLEAFRNALKTMGSSVVMTIPNTLEVEPFEASRRLADFIPLIKHHDSMMTMSFLTQFLNLGQEGRGGSFALSSDQSTLFLLSIMVLLEEIAGVFNEQVIPQLIDWNFGTGKYPQLVFTPFSDTARNAIMNTFQNVLSARFPGVTQEFVLELEKEVANHLGLEVDYDEVEKRLEEEEAEAKRIANEGSSAPRGEEEEDEDLLEE